MILYAKHLAMNSLDSMIEPVQNISTFVDVDNNCTAFDKTTGELCGETESLKIIDEFQKLYETRIENVDRELENEFDQVCMKLEISREWIRNLREQNVMLVKTVEDLEQAASDRVKLLEQKLKQSSMILSENMINSNHTEKTIHTLSNRVSNLEKDDTCMRQKLEFLQSDIRGLIELIRRATQENHWSLDGIKFFEIQPSDIPIPNDCTCRQEETNYKRMQSLELQIEHFQENEKMMVAYQRELEDKLANLNKKLETKEDTIKQYVGQLQNFSNNLKKRAKFADRIASNSFASDQQTFDETHAMANVDANACQETPIISYLTKVKSLMEQEKDDLFKLKVELERTVEKLCCEKDLEYVLVKNVNCINEMYSKKGESIEIVKSIILKMENNNSLCIDSANLFPSTDANQQFKLMDIFRACAIEAQATTEDIKDEMGIIASTFESRHEKYVDLNKEVMNVQNHLIQNREKLAEAINRLRLQEEERLRHNERINSRKINLKDIKNRLNHAQSRLSLRINDMQNNLEENIVSNYTEMCICNDLFRSAVEEVEQTSSTLQLFHAQGCCIASDLEDLKTQLCDVDSSIKLLQQKIEEALLEHDIVETTLHQKEQRLEKLEEEVDTIHSKIQDIAETSVFSKDQTSESNIAESHLCTQILNEIPRIKQDLHRLRKQQDELKHRISQKLQYTECDEKTCLWKCRVTDLQDQVKILQHEAKCNQEANQFLRNSMMCVEEELHVTQAKAENYRRSNSMDNMELKKKIIEFENTLKLQGDIECTLRQRLNDNEVELKKSKELLNSSHIEHTIEETLLRCGCNQFRHDTMTVDQLFKTLQNTMASTKTGLQELKEELKKLICEDSSNVCPSVKSLMSLLDKLQQYEEELDGCSPKIEELQNALYSKDKLLENKDEIIKIQKDSIVMVQAELKELHQKSQEKIDNQDHIISGYEKEKKELLKQNELQIQTIGHLQNAVVEAKKSIDQMGHRTMSDVSEQWSTISPSTYSHGNVHDV